mgnify:CR=1 FL=1
MVSIIDMQDMRYLNLFAKITGVNTRFCIKYNDGIIFCVPKPLISKAIGRGGVNVKRLVQILRRRVKIIPTPRGIEDAKIFIENIVSPVQFKELMIDGNEIILTAGSQSKAALLGRNKRRLLEMQKIVSDFFQKQFRII